MLKIFELHQTINVENGKLKFNRSPGGNRIANDGVDNYRQICTTIDKTSLCVLASINI